MPKALHNAEQLPRLNPSRAVPRRGSFPKPGGLSRTPNPFQPPSPRPAGFLRRSLCEPRAEPHLRLGLIPLPFLDFRKELVDFRKMLKKRWAWACPGAEGGGLEAPPLLPAGSAGRCPQRRQGSGASAGRGLAGSAALRRQS